MYLMRFVISLLPVLLLAACGVDGAPEPPEPREELSSGASITIGGESEIGVVGGS